MHASLHLIGASQSRRQVTRQRALHIFVLYAMVLSMALGVVQPAQAAAPQASPRPTPENANESSAESAIVAATDVALTMVHVNAPAINGIFDNDGTITVNDLADHFVPPGAIGNAFLQSRTWPVGEPGTVGAGLYAYLYRIDLRGAVGVTALPCVASLSLDFGPVEPLDYNKDGRMEHVFVVTSGGIGTIAPSEAHLLGDRLVLRFAPSVCAGGRLGGASSFFVGLASRNPEQLVTANLLGTPALEQEVKAKAPMTGISKEPGCFELHSPTEIPAPVLIDFDDLPDATVIGNHYVPTHGVSFYAEKDTMVETYADHESNPFKARSTPNVALNVPVDPLTSENVPLTFTFDAGKTHVGFYMGASGPSSFPPDAMSAGGLTGAMVGYNAAGDVICQITNPLTSRGYDEFIGMYDPAGRIVRVTLNYGATIIPEAIDDLYFAPGGSGPLAVPTLPLFSDENEGVQVDILASDNQSFEAVFNFPQPQLVKALGPDGTEYLQMLTPGIDPNASNPAGAPDVPIYRAMIGVPAGARVNTVIGDIKYGEPVAGWLLPAQPAPADRALAQNDDEMPNPEDFMDLPFTRDDTIYRSNIPYPAQPASAAYMGMLRDMEVWQISIAGGSFTPSQQMLLPAVQVAVKFSFEGGKGGFLPSGRQDNPFDGNLNPFDGEGGLNPLYAGILNTEAVKKHIFDFPLLPRPICWGSEFLIVTDPAFRDAADALQAWKNLKGISTNVVETGNGAGQAGSTNTAIQEYIQRQFDQCFVRPSYLLLLGDAEHIPPFYRQTLYDDMGGTDLDYSLLAGDDILPDLAYGRIPVDTLEDAETVIDKIIRYERTPPWNHGFYNRVAIGSYFQCCRASVTQDGTASRSFVETSEFVRDHLLDEGYSVRRIYDTSTAYHSNPTKDDYYDTSERSDTPNRYYNGSLLPSDLRASSGYAWDGDSGDVVDAFNGGNFLIMHRDHGFINGWGSPSFTNTNLNSLDNGALTPVVYSINCASGLWDNETRNPANDEYTYSTTVNGSYWAERLLRHEAGAVAVIGDTRNSPTWANSALARGLFDATWPDLVPYGTNTPIKRLGDIMNHGKLYMASQVGVAQTAGSVSASQSNTNMFLYHVLGDPTLQMWTSNPHLILLPKWLKMIEYKPDWWRLEYPVNGALITALQDGVPVARGLVKDGKAELAVIGDGTSFDPRKGVQFTAATADGQSTPLGEHLHTAPATPSAGGVLQDLATGFMLNLPAGATNEPLTLLYQQELSPTMQLTSTLTGLKFFEVDAFKGDGSVKTKFDLPWTMTFDFGSSGPTAAGVPANLQCMYLDEAAGEWLPIASRMNGSTLTCSADHFTEFAVVTGEGVPSSMNIYLPVINR